MSIITVLNKDEILLMKKSCKLAARTLEYVEQFIKPGITTNEIDKIVYDYTLSHDAQPSPLGYHGYPKSVCTSINEVVCHGVPDETVLKEGDIINVDVTTFLNGFHGDTSKTFFVGKVSEKARELTTVAYDCMMKGIEEVSPKKKTGDIGFAIDKYATRKGYVTVKEIGGHGIGRKFHDEPFVPSFGKKGKGDFLYPWRCITVEPMINETDVPLREYSVPKSQIKWYKTGDNTLSAQFEHTILVTDTGYDILTLPSS
jgi:methionyl aminopeptidase